MIYDFMSTIMYFLSLFYNEPEVIETDEHVYDSETYQVIDE